MPAACGFIRLLFAHPAPLLSSVFFLYADTLVQGGLARDPHPLQPLIFCYLSLQILCRSLQNGKVLPHATVPKGVGVGGCSDRAPYVVGFWFAALAASKFDHGDSKKGIRHNITLTCKQ